MKKISSYFKVSNALKTKGKKVKNDTLLQKYFCLKPPYRGNILSQQNVKSILIGVRKSF